MPTPSPHRTDARLSETAFHDLCGALTVIRGHTQLLMRRTNGADPLDPALCRPRLTAIDAMVTRLTETLTTLHLAPDDPSASTREITGKGRHDARGPTGRR